MRTTPRSRTAAGWMAIALATGFLASCTSAPEAVPTLSQTAPQWNATVDKHIADAQRASRLKQLGQQLVDLQDSLSHEVAGLNEKAVALNANYDATRDEARQLVADFMRKRDATLAQYRDIIFAMRREVSAQEWKALTR
jgi:outer membrane murein-binding lipoprotein Lpp